MPTTTASPSWSSRAPAAAMISVARISAHRQYPRSRIGLQALMRFAPPTFSRYSRGPWSRAYRSSCSRRASPRAWSGHIELQMRGIVVVATEDRGGVRAEWLVDDRLDAVARDDRPLRTAPDDFRSARISSAIDDHAIAGLDLLLVLPAWALDLAVPLARPRSERGQMTHRGSRPSSATIFLAGKRALHSRDIVFGRRPASSRSRISDASRRFDRNEGNAQRTRQDSGSRARGWSSPRATPATPRAPG